MEVKLGRCWWSRIITIAHLAHLGTAAIYKPRLKRVISLVTSGLDSVTVPNEKAPKDFCNSESTLGDLSKAHQSFEGSIITKGLLRVWQRETSWGGLITTWPNNACRCWLVDCTELAWCHLNCKLSLSKAFLVPKQKMPNSSEPTHWIDMQEILHNSVCDANPRIIAYLQASLV